MVRGEGQPEFKCVGFRDLPSCDCGVKAKGAELIKKVEINERLIRLISAVTAFSYCKCVCDFIPLCVLWVGSYSRIVFGRSVQSLTVITTMLHT